MTDQNAALATVEAVVRSAKDALEQVRRDTAEVLQDVAARMRNAADLIERGDADGAVELLRAAASGLDQTFLAGVGANIVRN